MRVGGSESVRLRQRAPDRCQQRPATRGEQPATEHPLLLVQRSVGNRALCQALAAQRAGATNPLPAAHAGPGFAAAASMLKGERAPADTVGAVPVQRGLWDTITGAVSSAASAVGNAVSGAARGVGNAVSGAARGVGNAVSGAARGVASAVSGAARAVGNVASRAWTAVQKGAGAVWNTVTSGAAKAWEAVKGGASAAWKAVSGLAGKAWNTVKGAATSVWDAIKSGTSEAWSWLTAQATKAKQWLTMQRFKMARSARDAFIALGVRGPKNVRPPTGIGGFAATYDPRGQQLTVGLGGGVTFLDSIAIVSDRAVSKHPSANMQSVVDAINSRPKAERPGLAVPYQWAADQKDDFVSRFNQGVQSAWSERFPFHAKRTHWEDLGANVEVESTLHAGAKKDGEHVSLTSYKVADDFVGGIGVVKSGKDATNNEMSLNSTDAGSRTDNLLRWDAAFPTDSSTLDAPNKAAVQRIGGTFRDGEKRCGTCGAVAGVLDEGSNAMTIRVPGQGADPQSLARERYAEIVKELTAGGFSGAGRLKFEYAGEGARVDFAVGGGVAQVVAAHEAGHMFGLGDEYAVQEGSNISGTGKGAGEAAKHDKLAKDMGLPGSVHENNDGMMSLGSVVRPQHYSTFFWALKDVTSMNDWELGPTKTVTAPGEAPAVGDFPVADRDNVPV